MGKYRTKPENFWCKWKKSAAGAAIYILLIIPCLIFFGLGMSQRQGLKEYDSRVTLIRRDGEDYSFSEAEPKMSRSTMKLPAPSPMPIKRRRR